MTIYYSISWTYHHEYYVIYLHLDDLCELFRLDCGKLPIGCVATALT